MSTVEVIALKPFIYSVDGYTEISVDEKQVFDLPEKYFDGLNGAGYVRRATIGDGRVSLKAKEAPKEDAPSVVKEAVKETAGVADSGEKPVDASKVEIPDDWRTFKFFALRSLASKLGKTVKTMDEAIAVVEAELAKRS